MIGLPGDRSTRLDKNDPDQVIAEYNKIINANPKDAAAFFGRGWAYRMKGDLDKAIADYTQAI